MRSSSMKIRVAGTNALVFSSSVAAKTVNDREPERDCFEGSWQRNSSNLAQYSPPTLCVRLEFLQALPRGPEIGFNDIRSPFDNVLMASGTSLLHRHLSPNLIAYTYGPLAFWERRCVAFPPVPHCLKKIGFLQRALVQFHRSIPRDGRSGSSALRPDDLPNNAVKSISPTEQSNGSKEMKRIAAGMVREVIDPADTSALSI